MAKTEKKVSISTFDKIVKSYFDNETLVQWHDAEVKVIRSLPLMEVLAFVDDVVASCFHEQYGFMPEVKDFAIKSNILSRYANFSLPDNLQHRYDLIYRSDAVDSVCEFINITQLQEIIDAIEKKIRYNCNVRTEEVQSRIEKAVGAIEEMGQKTAELFSGLTSNDMQNLISAIADGGVDEQKIVKAYIEQRQVESDGQEENGNGVPASYEDVKESV